LGGMALDWHEPGRFHAAVQPEVTEAKR
jgi:hypothetical protein